jgi:hypothetical protein
LGSVEVPVYDRPHLRGPWSRLVGGWWETEEGKEEKEAKGGERGIYTGGVGLKVHALILDVSIS